MILAKLVSNKGEKRKGASDGLNHRTSIVGRKDRFIWYNQQPAQPPVLQKCRERKGTRAPRRPCLPVHKQDMYAPKREDAERAYKRRSDGPELLISPWGNHKRRCLRRKIEIKLGGVVWGVMNEERCRKRGEAP